MASKNIVAKGTTYNGVESITLPTSPSGTATFYEISDTTAVASDVLNSKWFYASDGTYTQGTGTGGGGGGLEYETGTWTPTEDVESEWISFTNSHNKEPIFVMIEDSDISTVTAGSWTVCCMSVWGSFYGATGTYSAIASRRYFSGTNHAGANTAVPSSSLASWVTSSAFRPNGTATGYSWRSARTYKWIAIWNPTT